MPNVGIGFCHSLSSRLAQVTAHCLRVFAKSHALHHQPTRTSSITLTAQTSTHVNISTLDLTDLRFQHEVVNISSHSKLLIRPLPCHSRPSFASRLRPAREPTMSSAPPSMRISEQRDSLFFRLPPELRTRVHENLLSGAQPMHRARTRLPIESPLEIIDLIDVPELRPSNNLLATCHLIHAEAYGVFAAAQRAFWTGNNFQITLKKHWTDLSVNAATEPQLTITLVASACFDLILEIVVAVRESPYTYPDESYLINGEQGGWYVRQCVFHGDTRLN
jgi:hypothetical protein